MGELATKGRRGAIIEILRKQKVSTQEDLRERLLARGFDVTQATLSRDLQRLRARRVSLEGGGTAYEVDGVVSKTSTDDSRLRAMHELVVGITEGEAIVVMHTRPGAAQAIAAMLDQTRLESMLGTIAGDDTIFIVPNKKTPARKLAKRLELLFSPTANQEARSKERSP